MGWAAGLSAGVAAGKAGREVYNKRKISKGLSELDADQANREAADTEAGDFDEESGYDRNIEGLTAYSPDQMASSRGEIYNKFGDPDGAQRYEDQAINLRAVAEDTRRYEEGVETQEEQFNETNANAVERNRLSGLAETRASANDTLAREEKQTKLDTDSEVQSLEAFAFNNPTATSEEYRTFAATAGKDGGPLTRVKGTDLRKMIQANHNIEDDDVNYGRKMVKREVSALKTDEERIEYLSESDVLSPGFSYRLDVDGGLGGKTTLNKIDDKSGKIVGAAATFENQEEFSIWSIKAATEDPEVALEYALNTRSKHTTNRAAALQQVRENKIKLTEAWMNVRGDIIQTNSYKSLQGDEPRAEYLMRAREDLYSDAGRIYSEADPAQPQSLQPWGAAGPTPPAGVHYTNP
jgi:hypothetical protein